MNYVPTVALAIVAIAAIVACVMRRESAAGAVMNDLIVALVRESIQARTHKNQGVQA